MTATLDRDAVEGAAVVLGLTEAAWIALQESTRVVIFRACLDKTGMGLRVAKAVQAIRRAEGHHDTAYRCPFSPPDHHWHVGRVPSMESVATIAAAVRDLHGNLPTRVDVDQG